MGKPVIGLTSSRINIKNHSVELGVPETYIRAVSQSGGIPVVIPLGLDKGDLSTLLEIIDAVLFTGGGDIHPQKYHGGFENLVTYVDQDRDELEISLLQEAARIRKPLMGICRGLQLINVAMGGTLYEDLPEQFSKAIQHQSEPDKDRGFRAHPIVIQPISELQKILDTTFTQVNSHHHQGIRHIAEGLVATAHAPDGLVEAVEMLDYPFGIAVQWHPEEMLDDWAMCRLFDAFVEASQ
jgi:putative glutamine amidotransferase